MARRSVQVIQGPERGAVIVARRPQPPRALLAVDDAPGRFEPAPELDAWAREHLFPEDSRLYNPDHAHLEDALIGWLWTNVACTRKMRRIVGMAEIPHVQGSTWVRARAEQQRREWFGEEPDFIITLDALYCAECSDASFAALVEHELLHCAQKVGLFGEPAFRLDGRPLYALRGHDAEEFVGVVRRYGPGAAAGGVAQLVAAAQRPPEVSAEDVAFACGTCLGP